MKTTRFTSTCILAVVSAAALLNSHAGVEQADSLDDGLLAHYKFDGTADDSSGNDYHGTAYNDYEYVPGVLDDAIMLVGKGHTGLGGGHVLIPSQSFDTMPEFTIAMWVNLQGHTTRHSESFITFGRHTFNNTFVSISYSLSSRSIGFSLGEWGGGSSGLGTPMPADFVNNWHHLVLRADSGILTAFVDGESIGSTVYVLEPGMMENVAGMGCHWFNSGGTESNRFIGMIDDVRIYERALTDHEICRLAGLDCVVPVDIDVKPGSNTNPVNLSSKGKLTVAILSSPDFDAAFIDESTVLFAGASVALRGKAAFMSGMEDVNGDGLIDLVLHFATQDLDPDSLDTGFGLLTGQTFDGTEIEGIDLVDLVP